MKGTRNGEHAFRHLLLFFRHTKASSGITTTTTNQIYQKTVRSEQVTNSFIYCFVAFPLIFFDYVPPSQNDKTTRFGPQDE